MIYAGSWWCASGFMMICGFVVGVWADFIGFRKSQLNNTLLRVIPTLTFFGVKTFDISSGSINGKIFWHSILAFCLAYYCGILPGIYSDILFWLSGMILTFCSGIIHDMRSGPGHSTASWHQDQAFHSLLSSPPALATWRRVQGQSRVLSSRCGTAVEVRQCPLRSGARCWEEEEEGASNSDKI